MGELADFIRHSLLQLQVNDTVNFPLKQKNSMYQQTQDLGMFYDRQFKTKVDKERKEVIVERIA